MFYLTFCNLVFWSFDLVVSRRGLGLLWPVSLPLFKLNRLEPLNRSPGEYLRSDSLRCRVVWRPIPPRIDEIVIEWNLRAARTGGRVCKRAGECSIHV